MLCPKKLNYTLKLNIFGPYLKKSMLRGILALLHIIWPYNDPECIMVITPAQVCLVIMLIRKLISFPLPEQLSSHCINRFWLYPPHIITEGPILHLVLLLPVVFIFGCKPGATTEPWGQPGFFQGRWGWSWYQSTGCSRQARPQQSQPLAVCWWPPASSTGGAQWA